MTSIELSMEWLLALLTGPLVTILLTLAIAFVAFAMLMGEISFRRAGLVVVGSFLLVGSAELAQSLSDFMPRDHVAIIVPPPAQQARQLPEPVIEPPRTGNPFDPYSGGQRTD